MIPSVGIVAHGCGGFKVLKRIGQLFLAGRIRAFNVINRAAELRGQLPAAVH